VTDFQDSVEPAEVNPQEVDALDRVSDNDETDSALDSLVNNMLGREPAETPAEVVDKEEAKPAPAVEDKPAPVKVRVGDEELPLDEVVSGYMKEKDYRQKTQQLAEQRREMEAWNAHIERLKADPAYAQHVFKGYQPEQPKAPDDPIEAIKWEAAQQAKQEIMRDLAPHLQQLQAKQTIDGVKAQVMRDPLFDETQAAILNMVQRLPPSVRDLTYQKLDADPNAYMETYADARKWVEAQKSKPKDEPAPVKEEEKEPVARRERAPLLESAGRTVPTASEEKSKAQRLKELHTRIKSGTADDDVIGDWLETAGIIKKLS